MLGTIRFLVLACLSGLARGQDVIPACSTPLQLSPSGSVVEPTINFTFSPVGDNNRIALDTQIIDHIYGVENCSLVLYARSDALPPPRLTSRLTDGELSCFEMNGDSVTTNNVASGTVLKYYNNEFARPPRVPASWFADSRLIVQVTYSNIPSTGLQRMRCTFPIVLFVLPADITLDVEARVAEATPTSGTARGAFADDQCYIPPNSPQTAVGQPAVRFSLSPVQDSFGFLRSVTFTDQRYQVDSCGLSLYVNSASIPAIPVITSFSFAGETMTCFNFTETGTVSLEEVGQARILKLADQSVPRPDSIPPAWYEGSGIILAIKFNSFPSENVQRMRCTYLISRFSLEIFADVTTAISGCPETHWGIDCQNECQCQNGDPCHTFTGRCANDPASNVTTPITPSRIETSIAVTDKPTLPSSTSPTTDRPTPRPRPVKTTPDKCNIVPQGRSAGVGTSPINFTFSEIEENVGLWDGVMIDEYLYEVDNCTLALYARSPGIPRLTVDVQLTEETVSCYELSGSSVNMSRELARGTILKYLDQAVTRPAAVPESWYEGDRVVLSVVYYSFPESSPQNMRCIFNFIALDLDLDVWVDVETRPLGCLKTHWGTTCQSDCPCQNGGRCHTFTGVCVCPDGISGTRCENGQPISAPVTSPPSTQPQGRVTTTTAAPGLLGSTTFMSIRTPGGFLEGSSMAQCYPLFGNPLSADEGTPDLSFTFSPVQDSFGLLARANVRVSDQLYDIINCSLSLFVRTSDLLVIRLNLALAGETLTCFQLTESLEVTSTALATGTIVKFLGQSVPRPEQVPQAWYDGNGLILKINYDSFPSNPETRMRCTFNVASLGLDIWTDVVTTITMVSQQVSRQPSTVSTTTTTTAPTTTTTIATTTTAATTPSVPPEIVMSTAPSDVTSTSSTPATAALASVDMRPTYRCFIPPHEPIIAAVGKSPFNFTILPIQDTFGLLSNLRIADHVFDVYNCSVVLYIRSTPLPPLPRNLQLVGETVSCYLMHGSAVVRSMQLADGTIVKFFSQSLPRPTVVPQSWYDDGGLIFKIDYYSFPGLYTKRMKCMFSIPSIGAEVTTDVETTAVGCPTSHWGVRCDQECPCLNGGQCYTFQGGCFCPPGIYGRFCELNMMGIGQQGQSIDPSGFGDSVPAASIRDLNRRQG